MGFPIELTNAIESELNKNIKLENIDKSAKEISKRYRANDNDGKRLLTKSDEAIAYAFSRMPATYESVYSTLNKVMENNKFEINTIFDVGAGTGAGTWAACEILGEKDFYCFEREKAMIQTGKKLMTCSESLKNVKWNEFDIIKDDFSNSSDLIIVSYMINELQKSNIENVIEKLWNATNKILLIIEPGTPKGFSNIKLIREKLINKNANIIAPCPHEKNCELDKNDWCHFTCRVQRSKIHKKLKDGQAAYEDEKFSYIAFSKTDIKKSDNRILRHPIINKGYSEFKVCTKDGIKNIKLSKKDGQLYKQARKQSSGDSLKLLEKNKAP
ncbi:MAG: methyltransferase domain-containing protein [Clostridia bacterium]|nr:methyltransferase domain-containing protein [Clostridia bacterium]